MALLFYDGFSYSDDINDLVRNGWENLGAIIVKNYFREGSNAICGNGHLMLRKYFAEKTELILGIRFQSSKGRMEIQFRKNNDIQYKFQINAAAIIPQNDSGLDFGLNYFYDNQRYIEIKLKSSNSGSFEVKVDEIGYSALKKDFDTQLLAESGINNIYISESYFDLIYFSDIYLLDTSGPAPWNDFLGICQVVTQFPDADVAGFQNFTPSSGTEHYPLVNETAPDYSNTTIMADDAGDIDLYSFDNPLTGVGTIYAYQVKAMSKKTDPGVSGVGIQPAIMCECGEDTKDAFFPEYDDWNYNTGEGTASIWTTDPDTDQLWTKTAINSIRAGVKIPE